MKNLGDVNGGALIRPAQERIIMLDVLRGFALLGILIMNIKAFGLPSASYFNPYAYTVDDPNFWDRLYFIGSEIFASLKFQTLFTLLFGMGIAMMWERIHSHAPLTRKAGATHYRRMFWLLIIGLLHAYLLFYGDILVGYAVCGMIVYLFRRAKISKLLNLGIILFLLPVLLNVFFGLTMQFWPEEAVENVRMIWAPSNSEIAREIAVNRSGWIAQIPHRIELAISSQLFNFFINGLWRISGLMLVGMALYRWRLFDEGRGRRRYVVLALVGGVCGLPLIILGLILNYMAGWTLEYSFFIGEMYNYVGSVGLALAYIGIALLIRGSRIMKRVIRRGGRLLAQYGKMALTNYIMQSIICGFIFYGHGLKQFGNHGFGTFFLIVPSVWIGQLIFTAVWFKYFRYGLLEWLWRRLTYWRAGPLPFRNRHT